MKSLKFFKPTLATTLAIDSSRLVLILTTAISLIGYPKPASAATFNVTVGVPTVGRVAPAFKFTPSLVTIHPGDQVKWTWATSGHSTTSIDRIWDSGLLTRERLSLTHSTARVRLRTFASGMAITAPKRIALKSNRRLSVALLESSLVTSSDVSTHFRPGRKTG